MAFTLEEARSLLPQVKKITESAATKLHQLMDQMRPLDEDDPELDNLDRKARRIVAEWMSGIKALGAEPKGLWLVDFDAGDGCYCWKLPENDIDYFHTYEAGFDGREPIEPELLH